MGREWGIASLILAVLAWFVPFYGMFITGFAVLLAIVGAAMGDRTYSAIAPAVSWTNLYMGSPLFWAAVKGASLTHNIPTEAIYFGVGAVAAIPYFVMTFAKQPRPTSSPTDSTSPGPSDDIGEETWRAISGSDNRALFKEFIERFPNHPRVMLARLKLSGFDPKAVGGNSSKEPGEADQTPIPFARLEETATWPSVGAAPTRNGQIGSTSGAIAVVFIGAVLVGVWQFNEYQAGQRTIAEQERAERKRGDDERAKEDQAKAERERESAKAKILAAIAQSTDMPYLKAMWDDRDEWIRASAIQRWKDLNAQLRPKMQMSLDADKPVFRADNNDLTTVRWSASFADSCVLFGPAGLRDNRTSGAISGTSDKVATLRFTLRCYQKGSADGQDERDLVLEVRAE